MDEDGFTKDWLANKLDQANHAVSTGDYSLAGLIVSFVLSGLTKNAKPLTEQLGEDTVLWYTAHFHMVAAEVDASENKLRQFILHCLAVLNAVRQASVSDTYLEARASYYVGMTNFGIPEGRDNLERACIIFDQLEQSDEKVVRGRHLTHLVLAYSQVLRRTLRATNWHGLEEDLQAIYAYGLEHRMQRMAIIATYILMDVYTLWGGAKSYGAARRQLRAFFTHKASSFKLAWLAFRLWIDRPPEPLFNFKEDAI